MSTFTHYLAESSKSYDYKIKVAGEISDDFGTRMETALQKFEVAKMSAGKKTPIMTMPLDFPQLSNEEVTIWDVTTNYPASSHVMKEYLSDYMGVSANKIVVRKPGEPTEEYQDNMQIAKKSEYANKLQDIEYKDAPKVKPEEFHSTKANMGLLKELLKDRDKNKTKDHPKEKENAQSKEEKGTPSPLSKVKNPKPNRK
jgi:hypothetical protein